MGPDWSIPPPNVPPRRRKSNLQAGTSCNTVGQYNALHSLEIIAVTSKQRMLVDVELLAAQVGPTRSLRNPCRRGHANKP